MQVSQAQGERSAGIVPLLPPKELKPSPHHALPQAHGVFLCHQRPGEAERQRPYKSQARCPEHRAEASR